jgi:MOSC domain-containing protein YiiM
MNGRLDTVNVLHTLREGYFHETAIDKRPVKGPVEITASGLVGDQQVDSSHGGVDKAVYAYAAEDASYWADELGRDVPPGLLGENLRTSGWEITGARIGEVWQVGAVVLQVTMPRTPCQNLALRIGIDRFHVDFNRSGRVGALLRVIEPGSVQAGDPVTLLERPAHGVTVGHLATGPTPEQWQSLLDDGVPLARSVREKARRAVRRAHG